MKNCLLTVAAMFGAAAACVAAQGIGTAGADPTGASIQLQNTNTHFDRAVKTDTQSAFRFPNLAPFAYHLTGSAPGFQPHSQDVNVSGTVPVTIPVTLQVASSTTTLNVTETAGEVGSVPTAHTDLGPNQMEQLPNYSVGNGLIATLPFVLLPNLPYAHATAPLVVMVFAVSKGEFDRAGSREGVQ